MFSAGLYLPRISILILLLCSNLKAQNAPASAGAAASASPGSAASGPATAASATTSSATGTSNAGKDPMEGYRIVCLYNHKHYYRQNFTPKMINPTLCTHINYEFAILDEKTFEMKSGDKDIDIGLGLYNESIRLKDSNKHLKVLLSLGGWQDSTKKYSDLVSEGAKVENFIEKAVYFLKDYKFDGLDVAWEYPNCWQGALGIMPKDKRNFSEFLEKLRKRFDKEGLILSVSVGSIKREIRAAYDVPSVSRAVHHINVMTYDLHGPWETRTGHHTQMDLMKGDKDPTLNAVAAIKVWTEEGAEVGKLNLGTTTYAKTFTLQDPAKHGLNAPTKGLGKPGPTTKESGYLCYFELCQELNDGKWTEDEEKEVGFYAYSGDQWACYDPPMMMVKKAEWLVEHGLGGILIKDISCDDYKGKCFSLDFPLVRMLKMEILHRLSKKRREREREEGKRDEKART